MNLKVSMELAGRNLLNCLSREHHYLPYFFLDVDQEYRAEFKFHNPAHNIGRWWDAMLRLEDATGFSIPAHIEGAMLDNAYRFFDNPDSLCIIPPDLQEMDHYKSRSFCRLHALRENLLALNALARYRRSSWAVQKGHQMLETILRISRGDCSWDIGKLDYYDRVGKPEVSFEHKDKVISNGRLVEALIYFYETTGDSLALDLAQRFAPYHLMNTTRPNGHMVPELEHTHSYLGTLRGLLLFGILTNQHKYIEAVATTYRVTVKELVKESGCASHDIGKFRGETASSGDAAQLALWLADRGYTEFLDDVERIVRARLIPSQITKSPELRPLVDDGKDEHRNLNESVIGAFGGMHTEPHAGKKNTTDITAADVHSLADIYRHITVHTDAGLAVYFHFDYEDDNIQIISERTQKAKVTILPKVRDNILIRIPGWAPPESVHLTVNGDLVSPLMLGSFAYLPNNTLLGKIVLEYALPTHTSAEKTNEIEYKFTWRGDEITGVWPNSDFFPFYPDAKY